MIKVSVIPELQNLIVQLVASGILFFVASKFLFAPVKELLRKRQEFVLENLSQAELANKEANELKEAYEQKLLQAKIESSEIITQARTYGEDIKTKAVNESKEMARAELEKGVRELENEKAKVMKSMDDEIAALAIIAAEKVIRQKMDSNTDKDLVKSFIKDLEESYE